MKSKVDEPVACEAIVNGIVIRRTPHKFQSSCHLTRTRIPPFQGGYTDSNSVGSTSFNSEVEQRGNALAKVVQLC